MCSACMSITAMVPVVNCSTQAHASHRDSSEVLELPPPEGASGLSQLSPADTRCPSEQGFPGGGISLHSIMSMPQPCCRHCLYVSRGNKELSGRYYRPFYWVRLVLLLWPSIGKQRLSRMHWVWPFLRFAVQPQAMQCLLQTNVSLMHVRTKPPVSTCQNKTTF